MFKLSLLLLLALASPLAAATPDGGSRDPLAIVTAGASAYVIHHASSAPGSVRFAATELQRIIRLATGVELPISLEPTERMISLGDQAAAQAVGLSVADLPDDAFRIVTRGQSVYIVGKDSPRSRTAWGGGEARGTLLGTYAFMEQSLGVRWLMPGPDGEDILRHETWHVPAVDQTQVPSFPSRMLGGATGDRGEWMTRNGGGGWRVLYGHNWDAFPPRAVLRQHPEYLAINRGRRAVVPDDDLSPFQPKFCTTNPGLVQAFAQAVGDWFDRNPQARFVSISPSDGPGWCECEACSALKIRGPSEAWGDYGGWNRIVTPLIVKFYNDVARIVATRHPDCVLGGFIYYDYAFPFDDMPALEPNIAIMLAPLQQYGLTRYKPELREQFERLCRSWSAATRRAGYYGASTWMRVGIGAPLGPSRPLLKHTFATLQQSGFQMVSYYALPWDSCPVHNYLVMKLMWNAQADVDALYEDWMARAYGPAAPAMSAIYDLLDRAMEQARVAGPTLVADYEMTSDLALNVYRPHFATLEAFYREALAKADSPARLARVQAFGDNLTILHHVLAQAGALQQPQASIFHRTPQQYRAFLQEKPEPAALRTVRIAGSQGAITGLFVPGQRVLSLPRLERASPPRIDGDLSDAAWTNARGAEQGLACINQFTALTTHQPARQVTQALATYDEQHLYISFRCATPTVQAEPRAPDDPAVEQDDAVTVLIRLSPDAPSHWKLVVNATNARLDARCQDGAAPDFSASLPWQSATAQGEGFWSAELAVPLAALVGDGAASPVGSAWQVNLLRFDPRSQELSAWSDVIATPSGSGPGFGTWCFPR